MLSKRHPFCLKWDLHILSVLPRFSILLSCSFHYAWTFIRPPFEDYLHLLVSWFVACIIGAAAVFCINFLLAIIFRDRVSENARRVLLLGLAGLLALASGAILAWKPEHDFIIKARYLSGFGYGLAFVPGMIYAAEIVDKSVGRTVCLIVDLGMMTALLICSILYLTVEDLDLYHGLLCIFFAVLGLIGSLCTSESTTSHVDRDNVPQNSNPIQIDSDNAPENEQDSEEATSSSGGASEMRQDIRSWVRTRLSRMARLFNTDPIQIIAAAVMRVFYSFVLLVPSVELLNASLANRGVHFKPLIAVVAFQLLWSTTYMAVNKFRPPDRSYNPLLVASVVLSIFGAIFFTAGYLTSHTLFFVGLVDHQLSMGIAVLAQYATSYLIKSSVRKKWSIFVIFTIDMLVHIVANCCYVYGQYSLDLYFFQFTITEIYYGIIIIVLLESFK